MNSPGAMREPFEPSSVRAFVRTGFVLLAASIIGCGKPDPANRPLRPSEVTDFSKLFQQNCSGCHGAGGNMGPAPPLNDTLFLAIISDGEISKTIRDGRPGTLMPAFGREQGGVLTAEQVKILTEGMRSRWGPKAPAEAPEKPPKYPVNVSDGANNGDDRRGAAVFAESCASCHGPNGAGGEKAGAINDRAFLELVSTNLLRRIIITGRPDLGMPNYLRDGSAGEKPLSEQQISDLVALMVSWKDDSRRQPE